MAQFVKTGDEFDPFVDVGQAINILKRQLLKVSQATSHHLVVTDPREAVEKIARAIDPFSKLYPDIVGDHIYYNGVCIIAEDVDQRARRKITSEFQLKMAG